MLKSQPSSSHQEPASRTSDVEECALILQIAAGERAALNQLYRMYRPRLGRFLARQTRRQDVIDEVINDIFWIVWRSADSFRRESRVSTWLMGIAWRSMLKNLHSRHDAGAGEPGLDESMQSSYEPFLDHERTDWVAKGLARLPLEQRMTLELAYGQGHSLEEVAAIMDCPVSTVKARMFHARIKLRNVLPTLSTTPAAQLSEYVGKKGLTRDWKEYRDEE
ncbi:MAG TPA: sigma-70 family RNA polymerase sigma factor [Rhodocyclaceae bacterium]|nr:sigma-70 family RNA polymerase sigma factor [Rhodocyclaceae bacterium]